MKKKRNYIESLFVVVVVVILRWYYNKNNNYDDDDNKMINDEKKKNYRLINGILRKEKERKDFNLGFKREREKIIM